MSLVPEMYALVLAYSAKQYTCPLVPFPEPYNVRAKLRATLDLCSFGWQYVHYKKIINVQKMFLPKMILLFRESWLRPAKRAFTKNVEGCRDGSVKSTDTRCKDGSVQARLVTQRLHKEPQPYILFTSQC